MAAKRIRQEFEATDMPKSPMFISYGMESSNPIIPFQNASVFECKTCNRHFSSFQALGGHRASHKRPRTTAEDPKEPVDSKHKMHECGLCGQEFSSGQALGGHMRRHRVTAVPEKIPVLKRSGSRRIMCLDLNLTPLENDLKMLFGQIAPTVDLVL